MTLVRRREREERGRSGDGALTETCKHKNCASKRIIVFSTGKERNE